MVKAKCRQLADIAPGNVSLSDSDSWVVVKKQRITILVPPPSPLQPRSRILRMDQKETKTVRRRSQVMTKKHDTPSKRPLNKRIQTVEGINNVSETHIPAAPRSSTDYDFPVTYFQTAAKGFDLLIGRTTPKPSLDLVSNAANFPVSNTGYIQRTWTSSKAHVGAPQTHVEAAQVLHMHPPLKWKNIPPKIYEGKDTYLLGPFSCPNAGALQNQRMRAANLERKLKRVGGLSRWLLLNGLGQFIQMFQRQNFDELQLLNLTMAKLKDMGADAVGPRRKLIHAIDCLCQPYYF